MNITNDTTITGPITVIGDVNVDGSLTMENFGWLTVQQGCVRLNGTLVVCSDYSALSLSDMACTALSSPTS